MKCAGTHWLLFYQECLLLRMFFGFILLPLVTGCKFCNKTCFFFLFYYSDAHRDDFLKRPDVPAHLVTLKCLWVHCLTNTRFPHLVLCVNEKELIKDFSTNDFTAIPNGYWAILNIVSLLFLLNHFEWFSQHDYHNYRNGAINSHCH